MQLLCPVEKHIPISQGYGPSDLMMYGQYVYADRFHYGNDFACITGTPIRASMSGIVIYAQYNDGFGKNVIIEKDGYQSRVAHLSVIDVWVGQEVKVGQYLGLSGNSGLWTTGSHCHWDMKKDGVYFDGLELIVYSLEDFMLPREKISRGFWSIVKHDCNTEEYNMYMNNKDIEEALNNIGNGTEHNEIYNRSQNLLELFKLYNVQNFDELKKILSSLSSGGSTQFVEVEKIYIKKQL